MLRLIFRNLIYLQQRQRRYCQALTLIEILLTLAILGTLSAIALPIYTGYVDKQNNAAAIIGITDIESKVQRYLTLHGNPPDTLADAGMNPTPNDPWGNPYQYLRIGGLGGTPPGIRKDRSTKPLNDDFDLYSMGKDGETAAALTSSKAYDDIIRANNGAYIGLGSEY